MATLPEVSADATSVRHTDYGPDFDRSAQEMYHFDIQAWADLREDFARFATPDPHNPQEFSITKRNFKHGVLKVEKFSEWNQSNDRRGKSVTPEYVIGLKVALKRRVRRVVHNLLADLVFEYFDPNQSDRLDFHRFIQACHLFLRGSQHDRIMCLYGCLRRQRSKPPPTPPTPPTPVPPTLTPPTPSKEMIVPRVSDPISPTPKPTPADAAIAPVSQALGGLPAGDLNKTHLLDLDAISHKLTNLATGGLVGGTPSTSSGGSRPASTASSRKSVDSGGLTPPLRPTVGAPSPLIARRMVDLDRQTDSPVLIARSPMVSVRGISARRSRRSPGLGVRGPSQAASLGDASSMVENPSLRSPFPSIENAPPSASPPNSAPLNAPISDLATVSIPNAFDALRLATGLPAMTIEPSKWETDTRPSRTPPVSGRVLDAGGMNRRTPPPIQRDGFGALSFSAAPAPRTLSSRRASRRTTVGAQAAEAVTTTPVITIPVLPTITPVDPVATPAIFEPLPPATAVASSPSLDAIPSGISPTDERKGVEEAIEAALDNVIRFLNIVFPPENVIEESLDISPEAFEAMCMTAFEVWEQHGDTIKIFLPDQIGERTSSRHPPGSERFTIQELHKLKLAFLHHRTGRERDRWLLSHLGLERFLRAAGFVDGDTKPEKTENVIPSILTGSRRGRRRASTKVELGASPQPAFSPLTQFTRMLVRSCAGMEEPECISFANFIQVLSILLRGQAREKYALVFRIIDQDRDNLVSVEQVQSFAQLVASVAPASLSTSASSKDPFESMFLSLPIIKVLQCCLRELTQEDESPHSPVLSKGGHRFPSDHAPQIAFSDLLALVDCWQFRAHGMTALYFLLHTPPEVKSQSSNNAATGATHLAKPKTGSPFPVNRGVSTNYQRMEDENPEISVANDSDRQPTGSDSTSSAASPNSLVVRPNGPVHSPHSEGWTEPPGGLPAPPPMPQPYMLPSTEADSVPDKAAEPSVVKENEEDGTLAHSPKSKSFSWFQAILLLSLLYSCFGVYFVSAVVGILSQAIIADFGISESDIGMLGSLQSLGLIPGLFLSKHLVQRFSPSRAFVIVMVIQLLGAMAVGFSGNTNSLGVLAAGMITIGLGDPSFLITLFLNKHFASQLGLCFALFMAVGAIAVSISSAAYPAVMHDFGLSASLWVTAPAMASGGVSVLVFVAMDRYATRKLNEANRRTSALSLSALLAGIRALLPVGQTPPGFDAPSTWSELFSSPNRVAMFGVWAYAFQSYGAIYAAVWFAPSYFNTELGWSSSVSALLIPGALSVMQIVLTPAFGAFYDRRGRRRTALILSGAFMVASYVLLLAWDWHGVPVVFSMLLGVALSVVKSITAPSLGVLVPVHLSSEANLVNFMAIMLGVVINSFVAGYIVEKASYITLWVYCLVLAIAAMIAALIIGYADRRDSGGELDVRLVRTTLEKFTNVNDSDFGGQDISDGSTEQPEGTVAFRT